MNRSMITATNTMNQLQKQMDTIGHNMANVNTTGYKKREVNFSELLYQQFNNQPTQGNDVGRLTPDGIRQGVGARLGHTNAVFTVGTIVSTDRPLDIALTKEGQFLQVQVEENGEQFTRYTRDGSLYLSPLGEGTGLVRLVTSEGHPVLDQNGESIVFEENAKSISISSTGQISVTTEAGEEVFDLGVVQMNRPQLLEAKGNNLFAVPNLDNLNVTIDDVLTLVAGEQIGIQQGALEQSNVDISTEMSELLVTQRSYQFNAKTISIADQMMGLVNGIR
ncbi:flagellar hook-basal body protein [Cytobacillus suaedae]|nr:flagellar hook-basal body protein [Cytobacillus suaedae]